MEVQKMEALVCVQCGKPVAFLGSFGKRVQMMKCGCEVQVLVPGVSVGGRGASECEEWTTPFP